MAKFKVVITDREYESIAHEERILRGIGAEVLAYQTRDEEEIIRITQNCDALIVQRAVISRRIIERLNQCKVIARYATGIETVDLDAAAKKGICVANVVDYSTDEVSSHTLALLLYLNRKIGMYRDNISSGIWDYKLGAPIISLKDCVVGVIGFGRISSLYLAKLRPLCNEIWVCSKSAQASQVEELGGKLKPFDEVIRNADYISIHTPLSNATRNLFHKEIFSAMKKTACIINVSRGEVINEDDLIWALENGEIAGAALDVMKAEPPERNNPLLSMKNVILTPHAAWYSSESQRKLQEGVAQEVARVLSGFYPKQLVNSEVKAVIQLKISDEL